MIVLLRPQVLGLVAYTVNVDSWNAIEEPVFLNVGKTKKSVTLQMITTTHRKGREYKISSNRVKSRILEPCFFSVVPPWSSLIAWYSINSSQDVMFLTINPCLSSAHGFLQARIREAVAVLSSRGSSWSRNWNCTSYVCCRRVLYQ